MSRSARVWLAVWDGEHEFALRIGELEKLQEHVDAGPMHVLRRLGDGTWLVGDVRETIRLGLVGAGASQDEALTLVRRHVDPPHLLENVGTARLILLAALSGAEDERLGKSEAGEPERSPRSLEASSASPASTAPAP